MFLFFVCLFVLFIFVLCFVLFSDRGRLEPFGFLPPVNWSQTRRLEIRPAIPKVEAQGADPRRSRQSAPLHSTANAGSVSERGLSRVLLVQLFAASVWLGNSLSCFDYAPPSPLLPIASTGHPSIAWRQRSSSSGVVGCL